MNQKLPKLKEGDLIEVEWHDFCTESGWLTSKYSLNESPVFLCVSIGYFIGFTGDKKNPELVMSDTKTNVAGKWGGSRIFPLKHDIKIRKIR